MTYKEVKFKNITQKYKPIKLRLALYIQGKSDDGKNSYFPEIMRYMHYFSTKAARDLWRQKYLPSFYALQDSVPLL